MFRIDTALMWFRRDLRVADNAALYAALKAARCVYCVFVYDTEILDVLPSRMDRRVEFILQSVDELGRALAAHGGQLIVLHGSARVEIPRLAAKLGAQAVYANHDYEPAALARDAAVAQTLDSCAFLTRKDQVIFEKDEILTQGGTSFSVFTPYKNAWLKKLEPFFLKAYPVEQYAGNLAKAPGKYKTLSLADIGFGVTNLQALGIAGGTVAAQKLLADFAPRIVRYRDARDFPAKKGPSYLSVHLRFGTISIRELARTAWQSVQEGGGDGAATWLSELVWRDFYFMILHHHPRVVSQAFKPAYDAIRWPDDNKGLFDAWCAGRTGYPIVDAAMRQINQTGYMHNRLRMIAASFLVKDLLVDWHRGEKYFADHLNDFDLAANNGGWQWAASTGCDAQPYFRIFNPVTQSQKFDADGAFIRRYVPELARCDAPAIHAPWTMSPDAQRAAGVIIGSDYPAPVVEHAVARLQALALYKAVKA